jgi:hypothetical protein
MATPSELLGANLHEPRFKHPSPPDLQTDKGNRAMGHVNLSPNRAADPNS